MARLRENFQSGTVTDSPLLVGATTFNSAELADLMAVTGSDYLVIVLDPEAVNGDPEIVFVTAHTAAATSATISRGEEGSVARQHPAGTVWEHSPTVADWSYDDLTDLPTLGRLKSITIIAQGTTTYNLPAGITNILVECIAAGGGGGGAATAAVSAGAGAGGGGGGYARKLITSPDASYTVAVGLGGPGGAAGNNAGTAGGDTTFGSPSVCTATGGAGGGGGAAGTSALIIGGADGGVGTVGDILLGGQCSVAVVRLSGTVCTSSAGGAAARGGGGGRARAATSDGGAGTIYGGGGGGGNVVNGGAAAAGGAGADGRIIVYEFGP